MTDGIVTRTEYIKDCDVTVIFEDSHLKDSGYLASTELIGWYYGEPDSELTALCGNRCYKAEFPIDAFVSDFFSAKHNHNKEVN